MKFPLVHLLLSSSKWILLLFILLSWCSPSQCEMDMKTLCKTPLCQCSATVNGNATVVVVALICHGVGLTEVPRNLGDYPALEEIDLTGNKLKALHKDSFADVMDSLKVIILDHNQIEFVENGTFDNILNLEVLRMSNNSLTSLPPNSFQRGAEMNDIDLSSNKLTGVPEAVGRLRKVDELKLNHNPLGNLKPNAFGNLWEVKLMDLSDTKMDHFNSSEANFRNFNRLDELFLDGNNLTELKMDMFKDFAPLLRSLSISYSNVKVIEKGAFELLTFLKTLVLNGNNIQLLKGSPFRRLNLDNLYLQYSNISDVRKTAFRYLTLHKGLYLDGNNIPVVHNSEFKNLVTETYGDDGKFDLSMRNCGIERIEGSPFSGFNITRLFLSRNRLTDESMLSALHGMVNLELLDLTTNRLQSVPPIGAESRKLVDMFLTDNDITTLSRESFQSMSELQRLHLSENPLKGFPEDDDTFAETPRLEILEMEYTYVSRLPNLANLPRLKELVVNNAMLNVIPESLCDPNSNLHKLHINYNLLTELPVMDCDHLVIFEAAHNKIATVHTQTIRGMRLLNELDLNDNLIGELDYDLFNASKNMEFLRLGGNRLTELPNLKYMPYLVTLNASHNRLLEIKEETFSEQISMDTLYLNDNNIKRIDKNAFPRNSDLKRLNLSNNVDISEWTLPIGGFPRLAELELQNLWNLHQVPGKAQIPLAHLLYLTYSYHCCIWKDYLRQEYNWTLDGYEVVHKEYVDPPTQIIPTLPPEVTGCAELMRTLQQWIDLKLNSLLGLVLKEMDDDCKLRVFAERGMNFSDLVDELEEFKVYYQNHPVETSSRSGFDYVIEYMEDVICKPVENPLTPCENLMDPWLLRVAIWAVWVIAFLGNGTVLFVSIAAKEKLESNEFLICNLAFADLCMGLYLVFLATVDVRTFGSGFFQSALEWQLGPGCKSAGFIAIFSNELSVFILVILTLERVYTIASAFNQNEKKKKRIAMYLCAVGWLLAIVVASLPLFGVNSYSRVAVCLPYVTESWTDKLYVGLILTGNLVGFLLILLSYVYIFTSACKNTPATYAPQRRKDILIAASKIAVLILTAFCCWAPTALIGFLALGNIHLVTAAQAKYFLVFVFPLNACVNPFIYAIFTNRFRQRFASIFQRSNDKVTSFPPHHNMRLRRTQSAFTSELQMSRVSSSQSRTAEELTRMRQSRRSNSLVVQFVEKAPSPTFTPPEGCNMGRRASLPPGFGSTLHNTVPGASRGSRGAGIPHCILPFRGSLYSSNTSSLPDLQEEGDSEQDSKSICSNSPMDSRQHPLTSSQESNLRRLSVVKEDEDEIEAPLATELEEDGEDVFSDSSLEEYEDASDKVQYVTEENGTDLDFVIHRGDCKAARVLLHASEGISCSSSGDSSESGDTLKRKVRKKSLDFVEADVVPPSCTLRRKSSSWSDISSFNEYSLSPLQACVFATVKERLNSPFFDSSSSPSRHTSFCTDPPGSPSMTTSEQNSTRTSSSEAPSEASSQQEPRLMADTMMNTSEMRHPPSSKHHSSSSSSSSTSHHSSNNSNTRFDCTGIRQGLVLSSLHSKKPTTPSSSFVNKAPRNHTNNKHLNNCSASHSSCPQDDDTDSCTSINVETDL